jgi:3-oxoacyl-(acyl-carrier-protein) synthase/SAM-dependent methyltransferase/acyl carrier protein
MTHVNKALEASATRLLGVGKHQLADTRLEDLGLDLAMAVTLMEEINATFGTRLPTSLAFECGDIAELAERIESELAGRGPERPGRRALKAFGGTDDAGAIAVIGMSCRAAGAADADELWDVICQGRDCTTEVTDPVALELFREHFPDAPAPRYGAMADAEAFDPAFFRISPREAKAMDAAQRVVLEACYHALEDAAQDPGSLHGRPVATIIGTTGLAPQSEYSAHALLGADSGIMAARLAYHLDLRGPAMAVDTACSSSLVAVDIARRLLLTGEADMAVAGGVFVSNHPGTSVTMETLGTISASRACRPFDSGADGMLVGEGVGVLVLKRLEDAVRDGDRVSGVIRGSATNQDGRTSGITSPSYQAQSGLLRSVYRSSGIDIEDLRYVEAHGTGTKLGDPVEVHALTEAFAAFTTRKRFCAIGSIKANIGHTIGAAGVLSVIKVLLCLRHGKLPPMTNFVAANEHIDFANSPVYVNAALEDWPLNSRGSRLAAVSSFGYSGTNAHMVIEQYVAPERRARGIAGPRPQLVPLSAKNDAQLRVKAGQLVAELRSGRLSNDALADVAYTLQVGREAMPERVAVVATTMAELIDRLSSFAAGAAASPGVHRGRAAAGDAPARPPDNASRLGVEELAVGWCAGQAIEWPRLHTGTAPRRLSLPTHPFTRTRFPHAWGAGAGAAASPSDAAPSVPAPAAGTPAAAAAVPSVLAELDAAAEEHLRSDPASTSLESALRSEALSRDMTRVCRNLLLASLRRMGVFGTAGERHAVSDLASRLEIVDEHRPLFRTLVDILVDAGYLRREGGDVVATDEVAAVTWPWQSAELERRSRELAASYPDMEGFIRLLISCLDAYPEILTGRRNAHEVLFPGGSFDALEGIYHNDHDTNALVARLAGTYVETRLRRDPEARVSLLEIGAGTGGTTAKVLPALDRFGAHVRYVYSDISRSFTRYGASRYGTAHPFVEFAPLDIEFAPDAQGLEPGGFDVVLASNVLHATRRVDRSIAHARELLRPGGVLVLVEATRVQDVFTLIFGLTAGWWAFEDGCRLPGSPLLSAPMWRQALERAGLRSVRALSVLPLREDQAVDSVILAEKDGSVRAPAGVRTSPAAGEARAKPDTSAAQNAGPSSATAIAAAGAASAASPAPDEAEGNAIEALVADAWREVLGIESVSSGDNFQDLGGDSILATQVISRLKNGFPFDLELGELFQAATLADMARLVEAEVIQRIDELPAETVRALLV